MVHKLALAVASAAAALTLTVALAAAGFAPGAPIAVGDVTTTDAAPIDPAAAADTAPAVQIDTVYVAPPPPQKTVTIHKVVATSGGEGESENETGGDD